MTLNEKVAELKSLQVMLKELQSEIEKAEVEIKKEMSEQGKNEIVCGAFIVRYKTVESTRLDTTAIKKDLPEVAEKYTKKTVTKRFTIA